jgi:hypothetical protein
LNGRSTAYFTLVDVSKVDRGSQMPRVIVVNENGTTTWDERVTAADFETEHFQRCLAERLS